MKFQFQEREKTHKQRHSSMPWDIMFKHAPLRVIKCRADLSLTSHLPDLQNGLVPPRGLIPDMRLCAWFGARHLLLLLLAVLSVKADRHQPKERHYYIAAVEIDWKYSEDGGVG